MASHVDDHSHTPDSQHAMIDAPNHPEGALVVQSNGAPHAMAIPTAPVFGPQQVLRGGMDANTFLHAIRRRWMLAVGLGFVAAAAAAIGLWYAFPESSSATALFQVASQEETLVFDDGRRQTPQEFEIVRKTQLALLKSYFVLQAAVRPVDISSLSVLAGVPDKVEWLQYNLDVEFPQQGEILSISLTENAPVEDLVQLVNAVAKAYEEEVVFKASQRRKGTSDLVAKSLKKLQEEITSDWEDFLEIAEGGDRPEATERNTKTDLLINDISHLRKQKSELETQLYQLQNDFMINKSRIDDPQFIDMQVEEALAEDTQYMLLKQQLMELQMSQMRTSGQGRAGRSRGANALNEQIAQYNSQIQNYKAGIKAQIERERRTKPNLMLRQLQHEFQTNSRIAQMRLAGINKALEEAMTALTNREKISIDLEQRKQALDQKQEIANDMSIKLGTLEVEESAPQQIKLIQPAEPQKGINKAQHYAISILGGLATFCLTCLGVGYFEFRNRRLNGPSQVDEGLGIRVVGTLPSLSSRRALDPTHPIVAQLTESIDGVRTILMHDSTSKRRQVVLITSAATMEGRTTVASQLAASLARAGRRTLLIDGDMRRPALHSLFDVPLEDGLCEVLRAEVDVADVIRPTHAEGLWLLTAGYCDVDAIHALATEQMQPVFDKLRAEYDFVIIDGAPVLGMSDALIFGQYSDGAILSVRRDHSQMPKIYQAAELLRGVGIRIIGAVVNGVPAKADDRIVQLRLIAPKSERELQPVG
jgi:capsular exopolysaccharide synthesis family protein